MRVPLISVGILSGKEIEFSFPIKFLQLALIHQHRVLLGITQPIMKMQQSFLKTAISYISPPGNKI